VVDQGDRHRVVASQTAFGLVEGLDADGDGLVETARLAEGRGEVVARDQRVVRVGPEDPAALVERLLAQRDRLFEAAGLVVGVREVDPAGQGLGVIER
jgi:hypothetical protein